jgi:hypothetical protein
MGCARGFVTYAVAVRELGARQLAPPGPRGGHGMRSTRASDLREKERHSSTSIPSREHRPRTRMEFSGRTAGIAPFNPFGNLKPPPSTLTLVPLT